MDGMLEDMTWGQLLGWMNYYEIEPFGEELATLRAGQICATIANVNRGKDGRPFKASDFFRFDTAPPKPITSKEQWRGFMRAFEASVAPDGGR